MIGLLSACGGGVGSVNSTPTPIPAPTNTSFGSLKYSQNFNNDAAGMAVVWERATATGISGAAKSPTMSIVYNANTNGYTISTEGYSQEFLAKDQTSSDDYDTMYSTTGGKLTLISKGYDKNIVMQYVRMGLLQRSNSGGLTQDTELTSFTYCLPTDAGKTRARVPQLTTRRHLVLSASRVKSPDHFKAADRSTSISRWVCLKGIAI